MRISQKLPYRLDSGTFKAVEGITNAGGKLDVQKGYSSQLIRQGDTLYYLVNIHFHSLNDHEKAGSRCAACSLPHSNG